MQLPDLPLKHSMLYYALFPDASPLKKDDAAEKTVEKPKFFLRRPVSFRIEPKVSIQDMPVVVFDFETTGLSDERDEIIEVGAIKIKNGQVIEEMNTLTGTNIVITDHITKLTGIKKDMIDGKPRFDTLLPQFLSFIRGSILVAHNAEFDWSMLNASARRCGFDLQWPVLCTLKMSRKILPSLERHTLDSLANHYGLTFESRHRAVGDIKVLIGVYAALQKEAPEKHQLWKDYKDYYVPQEKG